MLYIHIPFCHSKCAYCDFYSSSRLNVDKESYVDALISEFDMRHDEIAAYPTVYIGGGTPSSLSDNNVAKLIDGIARHISIDTLKEFTIEMNPEDVTAERLNFYKSLGITRVSMGVQSFNDNELKRVGRRHSGKDAITAVETLKLSRLNFSCDLIYGLPEQTAASWQNSILKLFEFEPPHFSAYLLSYEEGTALWRMREKRLITEADEDTVYQYYDILTRLAAENGYEHYEISNFAKPGKRAIHNSGYWDSIPYVGIGASAHSFDGNLRRYNPSDAQSYVETILSGKQYAVTETENEADRTNDIIITRLRTDRGISIDDIPAEFQSLFSHQATIAINNGYLKQENNRFIIPESQWLIADAVMRDLLV